MSDASKIEWTDATWNPVRGCTKVSPGCANCYAETFAERFRGVKGHPYERGFDPRFAAEALEKPLHWRKRRRVFVNSMSDLFHPMITDEQIADVLAVVQACPQHEFQVLTKRPARMRAWFENADERVYAAGERLASRHGWCHANEGEFWPPPNALFGVSCEDQRTFEQRCTEIWQISILRRFFISFEPLLGPVDFNAYRGRCVWCIVGAESGPRARYFDLDWARAIRDVCQSFRIPFFFKQRLNEHGHKVSIPLLDGLRWCQFPTQEVRA